MTLLLSLEFCSQNRYCELTTIHLLCRVSRFFHKENDFVTKITWNKLSTFYSAFSHAILIILEVIFALCLLILIFHFRILDLCLIFRYFDRLSRFFISVFSIIDRSSCFYFNFILILSRLSLDYSNEYIDYFSMIFDVSIWIWVFFWLVLIFERDACVFSTSCMLLLIFQIWMFEVFFVFIWKFSSAQCTRTVCVLYAFINLWWREVLLNFSKFFNLFKFRNILVLNFFSNNCRI